MSNRSRFALTNDPSGRQKFRKTCKEPFSADCSPLPGRGCSRPERPHKGGQIRLPHRGVVMREMPMCLVAVGDHYIAAVSNRLLRALDCAQLGWVGNVLDGVDQQDLGLDLRKIGFGAVVLD